MLPLLPTIIIGMPAAGPNDFSGNVIVSNWLSNPVSLVSGFEADSMFIKKDDSDSVTFAVQNLTDPEDEVQVTVSDQKGWITGGNIFTGKMADLDQLKKCFY